MRATSHRIEPVAWLLQVAWGRRLETGLTLAVVAARVVLVTLLGAPVGLVVARGPRPWVSSPTARAATGPSPSTDESAPSGAARRPSLPRASTWPSHPRCSRSTRPPRGQCSTSRSRRVAPQRTSRPTPSASRSPSVRRAPGCARTAGRPGGPSWCSPIATRWPRRRSSGPGSPSSDHTSGVGSPSATTRTTRSWSSSSPATTCSSAASPGRGSRTRSRSSWRPRPSILSVELWCFDGKLVELAAWRRCCRRFVGADLEKATAVLQELRGEMETRYAWMLERGLRKIERDSGPGLVLVVIDELALYLQGKSKARDELAEVLRDIVARGRAAGIVVVAATQKPGFDVVPTSIRDLFGCRLALRCATRDASDTVLGAGWAAEGFTASDLDPAHRGVGYLLAEGSLPRRMRCFVLGDDHLEQLARRAELLRGTAR